MSSHYQEICDQLIARLYDLDMEHGDIFVEQNFLDSLTIQGRLIENIDGVLRFGGNSYDSFGDLLEANPSLYQEYAAELKEYLESIE